MKSIAVIGGGISGLSIAQCLKDRFKVKVFESASKPGGLIKCERVEGNLYHMVGGHVFNSRRQDVLDWFWKFFDLDKEFTKATRNAIVYMGKPIGYPIENHIYQFTPELQNVIILELLEIAKNKQKEPKNFEEFLKYRFGKTLYNIYFKPYNEKIWKRDLSQVPLNWLAGKLPMPSVEEIIFSNFNKAAESDMVHSTFYYPKNNGSQFLADRLSQGLNIMYDSKISKLVRIGQKWMINEEIYDKIIFSGNIKDLPEILDDSIKIENYIKQIEDLDYHGTTTVLCQIISNDFSWIYLPNDEYLSHRIICTGNFSITNNGSNALSATIEFTDEVSKEDILKHLFKMPFSPKYISHRYTKYTYPIQSINTKEMINNFKLLLERNNIFLLGRFAEWEYYNMDAAIGAAIDLDSIIE